MRTPDPLIPARESWGNRVAPVRRESDINNVPHAFKMHKSPNLDGTRSFSPGDIDNLSAFDICGYVNPSTQISSLLMATVLCVSTTMGSQLLISAMGSQLCL
jgi:hypothetical protein